MQGLRRYFHDKPEKTSRPETIPDQVERAPRPRWTDWFEEMVISHEGGETILTGQIADQAALHGLLIRIRDLNLNLLSVERLDPDQENSQ